ncbi:MAG: hypothetical protein BGO05_06995 [Rhizobiales bacterium 63-7]|nr:MAG: hypothetical protein BGO05_06995 [Rhizobiales bacterium 63-7]
MASAVPVVATDIGAFPELVIYGKSEIGAVIPAADLDAMAATSAAFMDDDARREQAGARGRDHVIENFSIEGEALAIGAIYEALLRGEPLPALTPA